MKCEIELYANSGGHYQCVYRTACRNLSAHLSTPEGYSAGKKAVHWYRQRCIANRQKNPIEILMAPTIRPEDIPAYEKIGYDLFKISGRILSTSWMLKTLKAYTDGTFDGNIADLCEVNEGQKMPLVSNSLLEGFLEKVAYASDRYEEICKRFFTEKLSSCLEEEKEVCHAKCNKG